MALVLQIDAMRRIASCARAIRKIASGKASVIPSHTLLPPTDVVSPPKNFFPSPQSISADLIALGLRSVPAEKISLAYQRSALTLKSRFEERHAIAEAQLQAVSAGPSTGARKNPLALAMAKHYLDILKGWRGVIHEKVTQCVRDIREAHALRLTPTKKAFNTSSISVLEKFYEQNSRPSRKEKQQLASQAGMNYKQVNTWFQNRRNRSKREEALTVSAENANDGESPLPLDLATALTRILAHYNALEKVVVYDANDCFDWAASFAPFHVDRPEHAWPVSYPPLCSNEPFPPTANARQLCTPWLRTPVQPPVSPRASDESGVLALLQRWSLKSEDTEPNHRVRNSTMRLSGLPLPSPFSATAHNPRAMHWRRDVVFPPSETRARPSHALPMLKNVGTGSLASYDSPIVSASFNNKRRWRGAYPNRCSKTPSSSPAGISQDVTSARGTTPTLRGHPYPQGKPTRNRTVARNGPTQLDARSHCVSSLVSDISPPSSPPTALPALSRESSVSSLRSVSSTSSSASDPDLLLTPPLFPVSVLDYPVPESLTLDPSGNVNAPPVKGLVVDNVLRGAAYLGYSLACGDCDPTLDTSSTLYTQLEPAAPFFSEPPLIPTISPSVLVF